MIKKVNCLDKQNIEPIHIFVTGGGGGGKSHLIRTIYHTAMNTFKYAALNPSLPTVLLMAPTGVAAVNISGTTVNTALGIPKDAGINLPPLPDQKKTLLRLSFSELKLLIIDEISMVSNNMLLHIHQRLKEIFGSSSSKIFAGISIIAVGDLLQLPPIKQKPIFSSYANDTYNLAHPWYEFKMVELVQIMRQKGDQAFIELLNRLRVGKHTEADICTIQSRSIDLNDTNNYPSNELHVWAENKPATEYNNQRLQDISMPLHVLQAVDQYPNNVSRTDIERVLSKGRSYTGGLDFEISIKEGARVMLTNNVDISDRLINGQLGTVARIMVSEITQKPTIVYVKFDDDDAGNLMIEKSADTFALENKVVAIKPILAKIKCNPGKRSSPEIQRLQFPLALAWACTVHKIQGLTLKKIVVSFELFRQRSFNYGQIYVALSRATSLQGLYVLGKLEHKHVKADPRVLDEYERLRSTSLLVDNTNFQVQEDDPIIPIVLLNIRSLRKHSIDMKFDTKIFNCDLLLLTETQLLPSDSDNDAQDHLDPFILNRHDNDDRYSSLAFCNKTTVLITEKEYFPVINALMLTTVFTRRKNCEMKLLFLYRKQACNVHDFVNNLRHIINLYTIDVILGDFNINFLDEKESHNLKNVLEKTLGYQQIVNKPTFLSGSLLDHVNVKSQKFKTVENIIISIYYSDHDAVKVLLYL
ncbi:ATP-dependent DNA helicase Pif1-like [Oculina patagonica]